MALFKNMAITNKGMALYAKAQAGQEIHFTKMQVGSGQIETQNPATLLGLLNPKLDVPITSIIANPELKSAKIIGNITNKNVQEATYICELGLFAQDPDDGEILYGYVSAGAYGDYYAPEAQGPYSWQYEVNAAIGNAANVTAELSQLQWDYGVMNSNTAFVCLQGGNQKEINKSIDDWIDKHDLNFKKIDEDFKSVESHLADITKIPPYAVSTGSANTYAVTLNPAPISYVDGMGIVVKINVASTGASTLNVNGLGAKPIKDSLGNAITGGGLKANTPYTLRYEATSENFIVQGKGGGGTATAGDIVLGKTATVDRGFITGTKDLSNLISSNIKNGIIIGGIMGTSSNTTYNSATPSGGYDGDYWIQP